jgi:DNA-binding CsgD family transcriptional regulator
MGEWSEADEEAFARSVFRRRWLNALHRMGVTTVGEVRAMSGCGLLETPQVGPKAVADISAALRDPRLCSGDSIELLGAPQARVVSERDRELVRMRQQGASVAVIARRFEISRERVRQILHRVAAAPFGLRRRRLAERAEEKTRVTHLR